MWNPAIDGPLTIVFLSVLGLAGAFIGIMIRTFRDIASLD